MATHSSILAWRIPWTEEPGRLQSMGPQCRTQLRNEHSVYVLSDSFHWNFRAGSLLVLVTPVSCEEICAQSRCLINTE